MKIINKVNPNCVTPTAMKDGQIGIIRKWGIFSEYIGIIVQKYDNNLIQLGKSHGQSWTDVNYLNESDFQIEILSPGTQLEI